MERVFTILAIATADKLVGGRAIHNAINLRLNPIYVNAEASTTPQTTGVFQKNPHETIDFKQEFDKTYILDLEKHRITCTTQISRVLLPNKPYNMSNNGGSYDQYLKIPIISQPISDYKVIVATAPWNMRISGSEAKPAVIYFVFPDDDDDTTSMNIPEIYFVKKRSEAQNVSRKEKIDPLIIVDSNRTVTGLKSKTVSKFIKFKNKLNQ